MASFWSSVQGGPRAAPSAFRRALQQQPAGRAWRRATSSARSRSTARRTSSPSVGAGGGHDAAVEVALGGVHPGVRLQDVLELVRRPGAGDRHHRDAERDARLAEVVQQRRRGRAGSWPRPPPTPGRSRPAPSSRVHALDVMVDAALVAGRRSRCAAARSPPARADRRPAPPPPSSRCAAESRARPSGRPSPRAPRRPKPRSASTRPSCSAGTSASSRRPRRWPGRRPRRGTRRSRSSGSR